ncbi:hypothetical protein RRG08_004808 [Elysia crispata]|uniref:Uncharacterized protein n=1 Tax=Elysia crispata TaxID=231223 RepID=A0AAE1CSS4_9GAST|nr:hypothetical protein RRG08_004808 [Elysia crispata]
MVGLLRPAELGHGLPRPAELHHGLLRPAELHHGLPRPAVLHHGLLRPAELHHGLLDTKGCATRSNAIHSTLNLRVTVRFGLCVCIEFQGCLRLKR